MLWLKTHRDLIYLSVIAVLLAACCQLYFTERYLPGHDIAVYYNQRHQLNREVIQLIRSADKFVYFAVYTFTRQDIKDALLAAKYRGLTVIGVTDKDQLAQLDSQQSIVKELRQAGIPVYQQDHSGIMHLKVAVTDKGYVSGSYNWTAAATNLNDEVLEVGSDERLRQAYQNIVWGLIQRYQNAN